MSIRPNLHRVALTAASLLVVTAVPARGQVCVLEERQKLPASDAGYWGDLGVAASVDGDWAVVGAPLADSAEYDTGAAYVYWRDHNGTPADPVDDVWIEHTVLAAPEANAFDRFGTAVDINGDRIIVGADAGYRFEPTSGFAHVFRRDDNGTPTFPEDDFWIEEAKLVASDGSTDDEFGNSVAICDAWAVVGDSADDDAGDNSGSAYVFRYDDNGTPAYWPDDTWIKHAKLTGSDTLAGDFFGRSTAISGDRIVVGAPYHRYPFQARGSVYMFRHDDNDTPEDLSDDTWIEESQLVPVDATRYGRFGMDVDISGDRIIVGDYHFTVVGNAHVFQHDENDTPMDPNDDTWHLMDSLSASDAAIKDGFGSDVAIDGDVAVVGAHLADDECPDDPSCNSGSAYAFQHNDYPERSSEDQQSGLWEEKAKLVATDGSRGDLFGAAVAVSAAWGIVGSPHRQGAAYTFYLDDDCSLQICGDAFVVGSEDCDDGNNDPDDGCNELCRVETGWICTGEPSACIFVCGDGIIDVFEECDDGNTAIGDGCDGLCGVEPAWSCTGEPSVCVFNCGDGIIDPTDSCDDGNTIPADGCSDVCTLESGWLCRGEPSVCVEDADPGMHIRWKPVAATENVICIPGTPPCGFTQIMLSRGGVTVTLHLQLAGWDQDGVGDPSLGAFQGTLDSRTLLGDHSSGDGTLPGVDLVPVGAPDMGFEGAFQATEVCGNLPCVFAPGSPDCVLDWLSCCTWSCAGSCPTGSFCVERPDYVYYRLDNTPTVSTATANYSWSAASTDCAVDPDGGITRFYAGTLLLDVPSDARGTYNVSLIDDWNSSMFNGCAGFSWAVGLTAAQITIATARCCSNIGTETTVCEDDLSADECDSRPGPRLFTPLGTCDAAEDCNNNGIPDDCDLMDGTREDCNTNDILDECEPDFDGDGVIDVCDNCPDDPDKTEPNLCGCGVDDATDTDDDSVPDCVDQCPGVDDAVFAPDCDGLIPTVSAWGIVAFTLLLLTASKIYFRRRATRS